MTIKILFCRQSDDCESYMNEIYEYEAHLNEHTQISSQNSGDATASGSPIFATDDLQESFGQHQHKLVTSQSSISISTGKASELKPCNQCECCAVYHKQIDLLNQRLSTLESSRKNASILVWRNFQLNFFWARLVKL